MSTYYKKLTEAEQAHWDEYATLRSISDWPGYTAEQDQRRADSRKWLQARRAYIYDLAEGEIEGETPGWDVANRDERYETLLDNNLNNSTVQRQETTLPADHGTDSERVLIEEREIWIQIDSTTDEQKARKQACTDTLIAKRKQLWHLMQDEPSKNEANHRQQRYDNLCIATRHGSAYEDWDATHDQYGKALKDAKDAREQCVANCRGYLGVNENPPDSNRGSPQPSKWQERVYGSDGVPWCACFSTCMAWDVGAQGSSSAAVQYIMQMAQNGEGLYRGWTTDPSKVAAGDMAVIGCSTCHVGVVVDDNDACHTIEGNTSPGSEGSQYNGGCVAEKHRARSEIVGWALVRYP